MAKIVVGLSGGVDSAVCAYLLKAAGHDVIGMTLKTWLADNSCCEIDDARRVANALDIPYYVVKCESDFRSAVVEPFINDYICGRTPNPCVVCNRLVKWSKMLEFADSMGTELVATGHYAKVMKLDNGRYTVKTAEYSPKDQTYMLYRLSQEQLARTIMPLGEMTKNEVRSIAARVGLPVADKPDSQEICFVPDGSYADFIEENHDGNIPGEGNFVDENGSILGTHKGIIHYTVGQRKGLGIAVGKPVYVKSVNADTNEVVLGSDESLYGNSVRCTDLNFMSIEETTGTITANVKIRYRHSGDSAKVTFNGDGTADILFDRSVRAATPGQSAVFYDGDGYVIGGGIII